MPADGDRGSPCPDCGEERVYVDEPMISGFRGWLCDNDDCPRDS